MSRPTSSHNSENPKGLFEQQEAFDFGPERPVVRETREGERRSVLEVLGRAFFDDPVSIHFFPADQKREAKFAEFTGLAIRAFGPNALVMTTEGVRGAAIWNRPGKSSAGFTRRVAMAYQLVRITGRRFPAAVQLGELTGEAHPKEPHYYLATLGTDPNHQKQGIGSALLRPVLDRCDQERVPAYLESSKEENVPFYQGHGFDVTGEIHVPKGPTLWPMIRRPQ